VKLFPSLLAIPKSGNEERRMKGGKWRLEKLEGKVEVARGIWCGLGYFKHR